MSREIDKVLIFGCERYLIYAHRDGFMEGWVNPSGRMVRKNFPEVDDLFAIPLNGLAKRALEFAEELDRTYFPELIEKLWPRRPDPQP